MSFKTKVILPVMTLAAAAILAACGGNEAVPASLPTSTPPAAPTATAMIRPPEPTVQPTLESNLSPAALELGVSSCSGGEQPPYVRLVANGNLVWERLLGVGVENYSRKVTGGQRVLPADKFQCVGSLIDVKYGQIISYGQDSGGLFPSKVAIFDAKSGSEVQRLWHPGHIKGVVPFSGVNTPKGVKDVFVVAALSNIEELIGNEPYVPVVFVVDRSNMQVITYEVVSQNGQALDLRVGFANDVPTISFRVDRDSLGVRRSVPLANLFNPTAEARAQSYQHIFN